MRFSTAAAILILATGVAPSVALPYVSLFCCTRNAQVLPFFADLGLCPSLHPQSLRLFGLSPGPSLHSQCLRLFGLLHPLRILFCFLNPL